MTRILLTYSALLLVACGDGAERRSSAPSGFEPPVSVPSASAQGDVAERATPAMTVAGGETSEFSGGDVPACPCGSLRDPVRATIVSIAVESVRIRIDELLTDRLDVEVGNEVEGSWGGGLPCYTGRAAVIAGDSVLAFYWPADPGYVGRIALTPYGESVMLAQSTRGELIMSLDDLPLLDAPDAECASALGNVSDYLGPGDNLP
jgi:hypothetical protein